MSFATVTTSRMELSPMRVNFDGVDLGGSLGNVTVNIEFGKAEIKADQSGDTVRDRRVSGLNISVSTELAEIRLKDNWKVVFPHAKLVTSGGNKMMYFESKIGDSDLANAKVLILHPLSLADADLSGDYKFFKACADAKSEVVYSPTEQTKIKVNWNILPDDSVQPEKFFIHGDPTIGLVDATAGSPSFVGTGNGTMTSVSVGSRTATENVVVTCIGTNGSNKSAWKVVGSVSGPIGTVELTGGAGGTGVFVSNYLNFTLTDGTTDFIVGDAFTVATVAANYV